MAVAVLERAGIQGAGGYSSRSSLASVPVNHDMTAAALSCKPSPEEIPAGLPCDPHRFRALFPAMWSKFCRAHFRDAMHCAYSLGVTERAARDWWDGKTGANGSAALYAVATNPGALAWIIAEARRVA